MIDDVYFNKQYFELNFFNFNSLIVNIFSIYVYIRNPFIDSHQKRLHNMTNEQVERDIVQTINQLNYPTIVSFFDI